MPFAIDCVGRGHCLAAARFGAIRYVETAEKRMRTAFLDGNPLLRCGPSPASAPPAHAMPVDHTLVESPPTLRAAQSLVAAGVIATVVGLIVHDLLRALPVERFALSLLLAGLSLLAAWPLRRWLRWSNAAALAAVWTLALAIYIGPVPLLAAAALGSMALAIGLFVVPSGWPGRIAIATTTGMMVLAGLCGWLVTLPIFHAWLWWPLSLATILWRRDALRSALHDARAGMRAAIDRAPRAAACVVLLLGVTSTACWIPAMQMDDIAYHLNLPTQLLQHGRYAPQPEYQVWSFAPWAGDVLHGLVFVLARREAHGALNALWLVLAAGSAWSVAYSLGGTLRERWAALALFASLPPLVWIAAGMQTELAGTAVLLAFAAVILAPSEGRIVAGAVLFAGLFALKLVHGLSALPLLAYALWRHRTNVRHVAKAIAMFVVIALPSYVQAWIGTGNPLLPMFNDVFRSPYFPATQYRDDRWFSGFGAALPWRLTFDTDRYVEAWDGGLGFCLIALAGAWLLSLQRRGTRAFVLATTAVLLLPLLPMQYARYAYPSLALLCIVLPVGLRVQIGPRMFAGVVIGVCTLNLAYQANASWLHHSAAIKRTIRSIGDPARVFPYYVPERLLVRDVPNAPDQRVLATDPFHSNVGELAGRGRTVGQHDPSLANDAKRADTDISGAAWAGLFVRERIRWVLVTSERATPALRAGLARADATHARTLGAVELWRLPAASAQNDRDRNEAPP